MKSYYAGLERRTTLAISLLLAAAALLAGCGGGEQTSQQSGGQTEQTGQQSAGAEGASAPSYTLPGEQVFPEGVTANEQSGEFFVGSTSDGTIFRGNAADPGTEAAVFSEPGEDGRTTAAGMKVDPGSGRLFVAGGDTGQAFVYDTNTGELVDSFESGAEMTMVNDVTLTPDGSAYFTDSMNPQLYRAAPDERGGYSFGPFLDLDGTSIEYGEGFNLNGIAATEDGRYLITVQSSTGNLYRIDTQTEEITQIDLGGETLTNGDGILLVGQTLYVVRNRQELIVPVELSEDFASGTVGEGFTDESFMFPTTIDQYGDRLLVVNSQFDRREGGDPELPFNVVSVPLPR